MAKQTINIGTTANDGTGDPLRTAFLLPHLGGGGCGLTLPHECASHNAFCRVFSDLNAIFAV